jgi:hypothetical protein
VADVGDVLHVADRDPTVEECPADHVRKEERPEVSDVRVAIHRRAA